MLMKAIWSGTVLAESDATVVVEGNHYFPPDSLNREYFTSTSTHTTCSWKGIADYFSITVDGATNNDAAWTYPQPKPAAKDIAGYVAFWRGVTVSDD
jgi:uncharacterized protein (DUF427 family)